MNVDMLAIVAAAEGALAPKALIEDYAGHRATAASTSGVADVFHTAIAAIWEIDP